MHQEGTDVSVNVYVQVACEVDPTLNARVDRGSGHAVVEEGDTLMRVSRAGRAGIAAALGLAGARVTAFALGSGHVEALRHALAAGAAEAIEIVSLKDDSPPVAAIASWLAQRAADLVIANRLAGRVAGRLGWAHLAGIGELNLDDGSLRAVRFGERGDREIVRARLPATLRLHAESMRPPYVSRAQLSSVLSADIGREELPSEAVELEFEPGTLKPARARTRLGTPPASSASSRGMDRLGALMAAASSPTTAAETSPSLAAATPEEMADEFVRYLIHHDLFPSEAAGE